MQAQSLPHLPRPFHWLSRDALLSTERVALSSQSPNSIELLENSFVRVKKSTQMGHYISGIVAKSDALREFASSRNLHPAASLACGLAFLPLSDEHLDALFPDQGQFDDSMTYLSEALKEALTEFSAGVPVAYIETEYFGGQGAQGATVYDRGHCVFGPITNEVGAISDAMRLLGVTVAPGQHDEFEAAGFCRHRNNEDWIEEAAQNR